MRDYEPDLLSYRAQDYINYFPHPGQVSSPYLSEISSGQNSRSFSPVQIRAQDANPHFLSREEDPGLQPLASPAIASNIAHRATTDLAVNAQIRVQPQYTSDRASVAPHGKRSFETFKGYGDWTPVQTLLPRLLSDLQVSISKPWSQLSAQVFLQDMTSTDNVAFLQIPSRNSCTDMLDIYHEVVSPTYHLHTRKELTRMVENIFLNGRIARRDIQEATLNSFALTLGHAASVMSRTDPSLDEIVIRCVRFTRTGLADIVRRPGLRGAKMLLCIILLNISKELPDPLWYTSGLVFSMCIDLGFHRKRSCITNPTEDDLEEEEETRRVFWTAYCLDRTLSVVFGLPLFFRESVITCPFPKDVPFQVLARYKICRLQSRIIQAQRDLSPNSPYPSATEAELLQHLNEWRQDGDQVRSIEHEAVLPMHLQREQITLAGNTELLMHRRGLLLQDEKAIVSSLSIALNNLEIYRTEALQMSIVNGIFLVEDLFLNIITLLAIYRFSPNTISAQGLTAQELLLKVDIGRQLFTQLGKRWTSARKHLELLDSILTRIDN